jgi:hypothetical protein
MTLPTKPIIALVVNQAAETEVYLKELRKYDVEINLVSGFKDLEHLLATGYYNGIIVDLKTKLSVDRDQKMLAHDLLEHYPVLQARVLLDPDQIQAMPLGKVQREASLDSFLTVECPSFEARCIRAAVRRSIHFNVLISENGSFGPDDMERTVTLDVSRNGCFIVTPYKWPDHANVAFIFKELTTETPIVGEIRWEVPWGQGMRIPGIGIRFEDIQLSQHQELIEKYSLG